MKNKILCMISVTLCSILLVGCGKNKADYKQYKNEVNDLYDSIAIANMQMNEIDIYSEESKEDFFKELDDLQKAFDAFSKTETPKEFTACKELSETASSLLSESKSYFHSALDNEYDETSFQNGVNSYNKVVTCVNYMGYVLQGKQIPESNALN